MAVVYVGSGAYAEGNTSGANVTYPYPTGYSPVSGDISVLVQYGLTNNTTVFPNAPGAGGTYTTLGTGQHWFWTTNTSLCVIVRYRILDGTEAAVTINTSSNLSSANGGSPTGFCGGFINIYRQFNSQAPFPETVNPSANNGTTNVFTSSTGPTPNAITTTLADTLVLSLVTTSLEQTPALGTARGFTLRKSSNGPLASAGSIALADYNQGAPGLVAMPTWSGTTTSTWVCYTFDIAEALGAAQSPGIFNNVQ